MKKPTKHQPAHLALLLMLFYATSSYAQLWHIRAPAGGFPPYHAFLQPDERGYWIGGQRSFAEINPLGEILGWVELPFGWPGQYIGWYSVQHNAAERSFLLGFRNNPGSFSVAEFRPGAGYSHVRRFIDTLEGPISNVPLFVPTTDSTVAVFGGAYLRHLVFRRGQGFSVLDSSKLDLGHFAAAVHTGTGFVVTNTTGDIFGVSSDGDVQWTVDHGVTIWSLLYTGTDFIGAGNLTDSTTALLRFSPGGDLTWLQPVSARSLYDVVQLTDGSLAAAGYHDQTLSTVFKTTTSGAPIWQKGFGPGAVMRLLPLPDGGFVGLTGPSNQMSIFRADAQGNTNPRSHGRMRHARLSNDAVFLELGEQEGTTSNPDHFLTYEFGRRDAPTESWNFYGTMPWLAAIAPAGQPRTAVADYNPNNVDFRPGLQDGSRRDFWRVWLVKRAEIDALRADLTDNGTINQPVPRDILTWPGRNNPHLQYTLNFEPMATDPMLFPAPFIDRNQDGAYNVFDGDLPSIKGDECAWWAVTDSTAHLRSWSAPLFADVYARAYLNYCPGSELAQNAAFVEYDLINRSPHAYSGARVGFWADPDVGCYRNDYIGSRPDLEALYAYNATALDSCPLVPGPAFTPPVYSLQLTNTSLDGVLYTRGDAGPIGPPGYFFLTESPFGIYELLSSRWPSGDPLVAVGSGYNTASTGPVTQHAFFGNPANTAEWSMCSINFPLTDVQVLGNHGPFFWGAGDTVHLELALAAHTAVPLPCPDVSAHIDPVLTQLRAWRNDGVLTGPPSLPELIALPFGSSTVLDATTPGASYFWSTGATTAQITINSVGDYTVTITPATGCATAHTVQVVYPPGLGVPADQPAWQIFPNPTPDQLTIQCPDCRPGRWRMQVYNVQGALMREFTGLAPQFNFGLGTLPPGVYAVTLWLEGRLIGTKRVVRRSY